MDRIVELDCPSCGAPVASDGDRCDYCGSRLLVPRAPAPDRRAASSGRSSRSGIRRLAPGEGEFGPRGAWAPVVGLAVAAAFYLAGWRFEDTRYWLDPRAIALWGVALPAWLALVAFTCRLASGWLPGVTFAAALLVAHLVMMAGVEGRLNDDDVGISAAYAGGALAAWVLGRGLRYLVRRRRAARIAAAESPPE